MGLCDTGISHIVKLFGQCIQLFLTAVHFGLETGVFFFQTIDDLELSDYQFLDRWLFNVIATVNPDS